jgi:hypothetical protein
VLLGEGAATPVETWFLLAGAAITATAGVIALARHHPDAVAARAARSNDGRSNNGHGPGAGSRRSAELPPNTGSTPQSILALWQRAQSLHRR